MFLLDTQAFWLVVKCSVTPCGARKWTVNGCQAEFLSKHYVSLAVRPFLKAPHLFLWHILLHVKTNPPT